jgi:UDP-N-acetylmuramoylalanine--D-glutamate ligase
MKSNLLTGKKVVVQGLGRFGGGLDAAVFASSSDASDVIVTDLASADVLAAHVSALESLDNVTLRLGEHRREDFTGADVVIVNPAVRPDNEYISAARDGGAVITSQIGIFFQLCPCKIAAVTGSNGKSTTTSLTAHLLGGALEYQDDLPYKNVILGGNIGNRPLLSELENLTDKDIAVLEISSFQAEQLARDETNGGPFAPQVCVITNLSPNHLDRHGTYENYCAAKESLFANQKSDVRSPALSVFNLEDEVTAGWLEKYTRPGRICKGFKASQAHKYKDVTPLAGEMNLSNLAAAACVAEHLGVTEDSIRKSLPSFKSLPHRLEFVRELDGVRWYNDSIATTPESVIAALTSFREPMVLIAGGYDKNIPFDELGRAAAGRLRGAVLIGKTKEKIKAAIEAGCRGTSGNNSEPVIKTVDSLEQAVLAAREIAVSGDIVAMSPACASYDMFTNFQQRGEMFRNLVAGL